MKSLKYYFFLFRWFLIGRYYCEVPENLKRYYWIINKVLWFFIIYSCSLSLYLFLKYLQTLVGLD